jgi:hypothetical protein
MTAARSIGLVRGVLHRVGLPDSSVDMEDWAYDFDAVHNIEAIEKDAGTEAYGYDALYRLDAQTPIGQAQVSYPYDAVGNRTSETQSANTKTHTYASTSNRQTGFDGEAIGYDEAGNRISDIDGARTYVCNAGSWLVEVKSGSSTIATCLLRCRRLNAESHVVARGVTA